MKEKLLFYFQRIIKRQQLWYERLCNKEELAAYTSLSPIDYADTDKHYTHALMWALKHRKEKDIKNIALTGPYGSGKSSVLKTFQKNYNGKEFKFLNISLATFTEEVESESDISKQEMLRLIELSILQQIFYHEEDNQIPDSRFKKIKRRSWFFIATRAICLFLFGVSVVHLKYPGLLTSLIKGYEIDSRQAMIIQYAALVIAIVGVLLLSGRLIRTFSKIRLNKLSIQDAEIELDENISKSILNHHLDELLYFFEATPYNVVIIEDLDRFQQTEIFTKLRELNLLLNNSKKIKKDIVFIYAVRDDMFKDKERAKFFDFIIPIIPVINSSNSSQKLLEKRKLNNYEWNEDLIEDIALFIDDMRLLHNITNEFYLYHNKLSPGLDQNKLLSMLIYKNIFPGDFTLLSDGKGILYEALHSKQKYIFSLTNKIDEEIIEIKTQVARLEELKIHDIRELRSLYLLRYIERRKGFSSFATNNTNLTFNDMLTDDSFSYLLEGKAQYRYEKRNYGGELLENIPASFEIIESEVDASKRYLERFDEINNWNDGKIDSLKKRILSLEKEKVDVRSYKTKELLSQGNITIDIADANQRVLIDALLRNGYIDENYSDYISIFYEGSLTKADYHFLLNVKGQRTSEFDYELNKIDQLIKRINILDFEKRYILNYNLVGYLISSRSYQKHIDSVFSQLKDESETSVGFIDGMITRSTELKEFVKILCKKWPNIWNYMRTKSSYPSEKLNDYFRLIIEHGEAWDIKSISDCSNLKSYIISREDFLITVPDFKKLIEVIKILGSTKLYTEILTLQYANRYRITVESAYATG